MYYGGYVDIVEIGGFGGDGLGGCGWVVVFLNFEVDVFGGVDVFCFVVIEWCVFVIDVLV